MILTGGKQKRSVQRKDDVQTVRDKLLRVSVGLFVVCGRDQTHAGQGERKHAKRRCRQRPPLSSA
jgi:hypothetical protein